ncbi:MAG: hypothetical protein IPI32_04000 [Austwickia sp.]|nr:hypothetical protein [Austwickia sp.]MBK8436792.1 hypothetical protein [Austwickia sp.]MBK9100421.1 hypothetical protein [Austwickia sp.]
MPKPTRTTFAALVGLATVATAVVVPLNAYALDTVALAFDGCSNEDTLTISNPKPGATYAVRLPEGLTDLMSGTTWRRLSSLNVGAGDLAVGVNETIEGATTQLMVSKQGTPYGGTVTLSDLMCTVPSVGFTDLSGTESDTYQVVDADGVVYRKGSTVIEPGIYVGTGTVAITATADDGYTLANETNTAVPASWTHTFSANRTISVPEDRKPTLIAGSSGDVLRVWNITGVAWNVNGTAVTLAPTDAFKDVPAGATGTNTVTATAATGYLLTGTSLWTLTGVSSVTIAKEQVPTSSDQPGSKKDTVNIVAVTGVKWKVNGVDGTFPAGQSTTQVPTGGKDKVTVTAVSADTAKYRLTGTTTWNLDFKLGTQITIPASREPLANDLSGTAQDTVTVYAVDKVTWTVGRTEVVFDKDQTSKNIPTNGAALVTVKATPTTSGTTGSTSADTEIAGTDTWTLQFSTAAQSMSGSPSVAARTNEVGITERRSMVGWAAPEGLKGPASYDVFYRIVKVTDAGARVPGAWKVRMRATKNTSGVFSGLPGGVYEVSVRAIGADGTTSQWSAPSRVFVPFDIRRQGGAAGKNWTFRAQPKAAAGTLLTSTTHGASWSMTTPATDQVMLWVGTGPRHGYLDVVIDGKRQARVNTWSARPYAKQMLVKVPVAWGRHQVSVSNVRFGSRNTAELDAIGFHR